MSEASLREVEVFCDERVYRAWFHDKHRTEINGFTIELLGILDWVLKGGKSYLLVRKATEEEQSSTEWRSSLITVLSDGTHFVPITLWDYSNKSNESDWWWNKEHAVAVLEFLRQHPHLVSQTLPEYTLVWRAYLRLVRKLFLLGDWVTVSVPIGARTFEVIGIFNPEIRDDVMLYACADLDSDKVIFVTQEVMRLAEEEL